MKILKWNWKKNLFYFILIFQLVVYNGNSLKHLVLSGSKFLTNESLITTFNTHRNLITVDLSECHSVTANCLQSLAVQCKQLRRLILKGMNWFYDFYLPPETENQSHRNLVPNDQIFKLLHKKTELIQNLPTYGIIFKMCPYMIFSLISFQRILIFQLLAWRKFLNNVNEIFAESLWNSVKIKYLGVAHFDPVL